jgi:hypothetical protein
MKNERTGRPDTQLWGIYHDDREYARVHGNPLRTVIEAPTKLAAEEEATRLGFSEPWAHPVSQEEAKHAEWIAIQRTRPQQVITRPAKRGIHV